MPIVSTLQNCPLKLWYSGPIHALTYSAGAGQYLLSGSSDRSINLYNPTSAIANPNATGLIQSYTGAHIYEVLTLAVSADNARFISGGGDKTVFVWDVATARTVKKLSGHGGRIECVAWGGDGDGGSVVVSGSFDATVRLWDMKAQSATRPIMVLDEARDSVSCVAVVGHEVMAGSVDGRVRVYDLRMGLVHVDVLARELLPCLSGVVVLHELLIWEGREAVEPVTSLTPSMQGDTLLVSTLDSTLRLMDKANGKMLQSYTDAEYVNTTYRIRSTLAGNDSFVLSGAEDGSIYAWDVVSGKLLKRLTHGEVDAISGHQPNIRSSRKVVSALAHRRRRDEWASAGGDGRFLASVVTLRLL